MIVVGLGYVFFTRPVPDGQGQNSLVSLPPAPGEFARVMGPVKLQFPKDLGAHPETQTEWWYFTGNLQSQEGRSYGFQLTFFRRALAPAGEIVPRSSDWASAQVFLAHFALTDGAAGTFYQFEQIERGAAGLAGAVGEPAFHVWLRDWSVAQTGTSRYEVKAAQDGVELSLVLLDQKGAILQGDHGYSQKGPQAGNASTYVSLTHLKSSGTIRVGGQSYHVEGLSWMDHEYGTDALGDGEVGWDWFSMHLDDGSELMVYHIRNKDGSISPYSKGTLVFQDGSSRALAAKDFEISVGSYWKSPHSGGNYPAGWTIQILSDDLVITVQPLIPDQELNNSFVYWEGAVRISGKQAGSVISGLGYVELTGYARSFEGGF